MLQAVAAIAGLAILLWSLGLPSLRFAEAANVTTFSDTLTDSAPSTGSNHTIVFTVPAEGTPITSAGAITITFPSTPDVFNLSNIGVNDVDFASSSDYTLVADGTESAADEWGVATTSTTIVLNPSASIVTIATGTQLTIEVGTNATAGGNGDAQIVNPATSNTSYEISVATGMGDSGNTRVAIIDTVTVNASVDTSLDFQVFGTAAGLTVNGTTTTGAATATTIPFGELSAGSASTAAQRLTVETNAANGFVVTVVADQLLLSSTGADIDLFANGTAPGSPTNWTKPTGTLGDDDTYGHWGVTTDDATTGVGLTDEFGDQQYMAVSTSTPVEIFRHNGPSDGSTASIGSTTVAYSVQITNLQEAGDDYTATLTYVATPVF